MSAAKNEVFRLYLKACGTTRSPHSGRSLYNHLCGTEKVLKSWGCTQKVISAGLFHSIYGTNAYRFSTLDASNRDALMKLIGEDAELLVYLFSICNRPRCFLAALDSGGIQNRFDGQFLRIEKEVLKNLIEIECANLIEQNSQSKFLSHIVDAVESGELHIEPLAYKAVSHYVGNIEAL